MPRQTEPKFSYNYRTTPTIQKKAKKKAKKEGDNLSNKIHNYLSRYVKSKPRKK
jgi:hypothetical protein